MVIRYLISSPPICFSQPLMIAGSAGYCMMQKHRYMVKILGMNECVTYLRTTLELGVGGGGAGHVGRMGLRMARRRSMERSTWKYIGNTIGSTEGDRGALLCRKMEGKYIAYKSLGFLPIADGLKEIGTDIANLEHHRCYDNIPEFFATWGWRVARFGWVGERGGGGEEGRKRRGGEEIGGFFPQ